MTTKSNGRSGIDPRTLEDLIQQAHAPPLVPISPQEAVEMYLDELSADSAQSTVTTHRSRLKAFIEWTELQDADNLNDLTGRHVHEFRIWRQEEGGLSRVSLKSQMDTFRKFIRFAETIDAVTPGLSEKVQSPSLADGEGVRHEMLETERAGEVLDYLRKYHYGSLGHISLELIAGTGMRLGTVHGLDLEDVCLDESGTYLAIQHREDQTPLKNKKKSERYVYIPPKLALRVRDYIDDVRPDTTDEFGRSPLLATPYGRLGKSTIRKYAYRWTRPCVLSGKCPHGEDIATCLPARTLDQASRCPYSRSPHTWRRAYISTELLAGVPVEVLSDRCDVDIPTLEAHYDQRTELEKMGMRRDLMESIRQKKPGYGDE